MKYILVAFLAQSVERAALNRAVVGSRPTGGVLFGIIYVNKKKVGIKVKKALPLGIEPRTYRLTADRSAD